MIRSSRIITIKSWILPCNTVHFLTKCVNHTQILLSKYSDWHHLGELFKPRQILFIKWKIGLINYVLLARWGKKSKPLIRYEMCGIGKVKHIPEMHAGCPRRHHRLSPDGSEVCPSRNPFESRTPHSLCQIPRSYNDASFSCVTIVT